MVFAHGIVAASGEGDLELGADTVGGTDQHRTAKSGELIHGAKAADLGEDAGRERPARELLDGGYGAIRLVDIDAGVAIANACFGRQISV